MTSPKWVIHKTSSFASCFLNHQNQTGSVHSVYRKTINLNFGGQLLALQANSSPLSPISLITSLDERAMEELPITPGLPVIPIGQALLIGEQFLFSYEHAVLHDLKLDNVPLSSDNLSDLEENCLLALSMGNAGSFELLLTDPAKASTIPFLAVAQKRFSEGISFLRQSRWEDAADTLTRLIGLGLGLTPGGDDFLCGVLAALILCGLGNAPGESFDGHSFSDSGTASGGWISGHPFALALARKIQEHLCDTNDISAAFLQCALRGQFSLALNSLADVPSASRLLSSFREIGHSSGTDTLCGVYYILKHRSLLAVL